MKNNIREQKAITLVALIITIIVLLILAIVSINLVMNGGIINKSKTSVDKYSQEEVEEQIKLAYSEWQMGQYTGETRTAAAFMQDKLIETLGDSGLTVTGSFKVTLSNGKEYFYNAKTGQMANSEVDLYPTVTATTDNQPVQENSKYTVDGKTAIIPAGYAISNTVAEQSIDTGLVITKGGNEWVWIPVSNEDFSAMFGTATDDGWTMSGTDVKTKYKTNSAIISGVTRGNPGTTDYREPDVLNNDSYDKNTTNLSAAGLGANLSEMATNLKNDYKNMMDSVRKNGGFYVGRYELSSAGTKKNQASLTNTNWYNLYKACKDIDSSGVVTAMIWGCQWDQVCKFINTSGDKVSLTNSTSYGNYSNSSGNANVSGKGSKQVTGYSDYWKANNIYDIAGNCYEWTQEACSTNGRATRGGVCNVDGDYRSVTYRGSSNPTHTGSNRISSRPTLYIK